VNAVGGVSLHQQKNKSKSISENFFRVILLFKQLEQPKYCCLVVIEAWHLSQVPPSTMQIA
jgi:hypothetical protein